MMGIETPFHRNKGTSPQESKRMTPEELRAYIGQLQAIREAFIGHLRSFEYGDWQYDTAAKVIHELATAERMIDQKYRRYKVVHEDGSEHLCFMEWHDRDWYYVDAGNRDWRVLCDSVKITKEALDARV